LSSLGPHSTQFDFDNKLNELRVLEARKYLAGLQGEFREKKINSRACVERGSVLGNINTVIERENPDLISIASHGRTGLTRIIYGSIAAGVLHQVERPLLLIRTDGDF
jgi:nucleotide-binding universal stress UspA family protein